MQYRFKTFFKNINSEGVGIACLDFSMEVLDADFRDDMVKKIMKLLTEEPAEEKEEKPSVLGFDTGSSGTGSVDEED